MQIRRLAIENVRSFLVRREIVFDGQISILIGPNGGGKTNLLDTLVIMLRRYIFNSPYYIHSPTAEEPNRWQEQYNDQLNQLFFDKNSAGVGLDQVIEIELEITQDDVDNMRLIQSEADQVLAAQKRRFVTNPWQGVKDWNVAAIAPGARVVAIWRNGAIVQPSDAWAQHFLRYLNVFETDNNFRAEAGMSPLRMPMIYLPVNRASSGFSSSIGLAGYNDFDQKRTSDAASSKSGSNVIPLAIGSAFRLARWTNGSSLLPAPGISAADNGTAFARQPSSWPQWFGSPPEQHGFAAGRPGAGRWPITPNFKTRQIGRMAG